MRDQRDLRLRHRLALFLPGGVAAGEKLVDVLHADLHGLGGRALEIGIERGVDAIALVFEIGLGEIFEQVVFHHVHKIGSGAAADAAADEFQLGLLGGGFLGPR